MGNQGMFGKAAICLYLLSLLLLASCSPTADTRDDAPLTPALGVQATGTPCPSLTPYPTVTARPAKLVFALVDKSKSYQRWTLPALVRFAEVLPIVVSPGDELIVAWVGTNSEDPTEVFFHERATYLAPPKMEAPPGLPTLIPTPTVYATPTHPSEGRTTVQQLQHQATCESVRVANEHEISRVREQNDLAINGYYCALQSWNASCDTATTVWERENQQALHTFIDETSATLKAVKVGGYDDWTHIYEALWVASSVFQSNIARERFGGYKLVIFSDMEDDRLGDRHNLPLDLAKVDVVVAMFYCREAHRCEAEKDAWIAVFENAGARSITFLLVAESTLDALASALR